MHIFAKNAWFSRKDLMPYILVQIIGNEDLPTPIIKTKWNRINGE